MLIGQLDPSCGCCMQKQLNSNRIPVGYQLNLGNWVLLFYFRQERVHYVQSKVCLSSSIKKKCEVIELIQISKPVGPFWLICFVLVMLFCYVMLKLWFYMTWTASFTDSANWPILFKLFATTGICWRRNKHSKELTNLDPTNVETSKPTSYTVCIHPEEQHLLLV